MTFIEGLLKGYFYIFVNAIVGGFVVIFFSGCAVFENSRLSSPSFSLIHNVKYDYYDVTGRTAKELSESMRQLGGAGTGTGPPGHISWKVDWKFKHKSDRNFCVLREGEVIVSATIKIPRWASPDDVSPELVSQWESFVDALTKHELGHLDHAVRAGEEIIAAFKTFVDFSCSELAKRANRDGNKIIGKYKKIDSIFEKETNHGMNEGAIWPPR